MAFFEAQVVMYLYGTARRVFEKCAHRLFHELEYASAIELVCVFHGVNVRVLQYDRNELRSRVGQSSIIANFGYLNKTVGFDHLFGVWRCETEKIGESYFCHHWNGSNAEQRC